MKGAVSKGGGNNAGSLEELKRLRAELDEAREREHDLEDTRRAMLYLLEDINESTSHVERAKSQWEATFDSIADPLFMHGRDFRIVRCNRAYSVLAGAPFKEIIGRPYFEVFPRTGAPSEACLKTMETGAPTEGECIITHGEKRFRLRVYPVRAEGVADHIYMHVMEDVTEEKRAEERERILYDFTSRVTSEVDMSYRLRTICEAVVELGYRMAWIGLLDEGAKEIIPAAHSGAEEGYLSSIRIRYDDSPLGQGPAGRAVRTKRPEVQSNISTDERYAPWREEALKRGYRSSASFPMAEKDRVIGVLSVYSGQDGFPSRDVEFLQTFANRAAVYIRNSILFKEAKESAEKLAREAELTKNLLKLAEATAQTTDITKLMEHVVGCVRTILSSDACLSYLYDPERQRFVPSREAGLPRGSAPIFRAETVGPDEDAVKRAFEVNGPVVDLSEGGGIRHEDRGGLARLVSRMLPAEPGAVVVMPVTGREAPLALILSLYGRGRAAPVFGEKELGLMRGISRHVSTALEEARLYKETVDKTIELSRKIEIIQTMHEIDRSILSTLKPGEILDTAVMMLRRLISCDRATVALADRERKGFTYAAGFGVETLPKGGFVPFEDTSAYEVVSTGRPQYVPDVSGVEGIPRFEEKLLGEGFLSHIRVPLVIKGEVAGVLSIGAKRPAAFSLEDLSTIEKFASQISVALENSRLLTDLEDLFIGVVRTLSEAIDAKSPWTRGHSERVTGIALSIAREMGLPADDLKTLELAGLLHDIGKIGTYEAILDKPGALTPGELEAMRLHPAKGAEILTPIRQMNSILPVIRHHHEHYDGRGYPDGLKAGEIPLMARILAVADTVDAMGADRPYRKGKPMGAIVEELKRCSGTQFDPGAVRAFLRVKEASAS